MTKDYRTVCRAASDEFTEKRSRFIGHIAPVTTEEEAQAFVAARKKECWDAKHNVWAYVLREGGVRRFSDDGEPQGTAGMPVLDVLQKEGVTDCVVVVTRYFGGILLGGGGLVRAYSHAARLAVDAGVRCDMRCCELLSLTCDYAQYGWAAPLLQAHGAVLDDTVFEEAVTLRFHLPFEAHDGLQKALTEQSAGALTLAEEGEGFYPFPVEK